MLYLRDGTILISEIQKINSVLGDPDCVLIKPHCVAEDLTISPWLMNYTLEERLMTLSENIMTMADPSPTLLEKYLKNTK